MNGIPPSTYHTPLSAISLIVTWIYPPTHSAQSACVLQGWHVRHLLSLFETVSSSIWRTTVSPLELTLTNRTEDGNRRHENIMKTEDCSKRKIDHPTLSGSLIDQLITRQSLSMPSGPSEGGVGIWIDAVEQGV